MGEDAVSEDVNEPLACGMYNEHSHTFVAVSVCDVLVWDARNGALLRTYPDAAPAQITSATLCARGRKLMLGDHSGAVREIQPRYSRDVAEM